MTQSWADIVEADESSYILDENDYDVNINKDALNITKNDKVMYGSRYDDFKVINENHIKFVDKKNKNSIHIKKITNIEYYGIIDTITMDLYIVPIKVFEKISKYINYKHVNIIPIEDSTNNKTRLTYKNGGHILVIKDKEEVVYQSINILMSEVSFLYSGKVVAKLILIDDKYMLINKHKIITTNQDICKTIIDMFIKN